MYKLSFIFIIILIFTNCTPAPKKADCGCKFKKDLLVLAMKKSIAAENTEDLRKKSIYARDGIALANQCLLRNKNNVGCYYYRAVNRGLDLQTRTVAVKKGLHEMIADFNKVLELGPRYDDGGAYLALGYVYLKAPSLPILGSDIKRDLKRAQAMADQALHIAPKNPHNLTLKGEIAFKLRNYTTAVTYFKKALKYFPSSSKLSLSDQKLKQSVKKWLKKARKKM
ncbi:MAG: hypothetical protein ABII18_01425 [bacterium]|nr:hypothetical protein [bacterium]MBU1919115.1 hypothetical protein [bacterium]